MSEEMIDIAIIFDVDGVLVPDIRLSLDMRVPGRQRVVHTLRADSKEGAVVQKEMIKGLDETMVTETYFVMPKFAKHIISNINRLNPYVVAALKEVMRYADNYKIKFFAISSNQDHKADEQLIKDKLFKAGIKNRNSYGYEYVDFRLFNNSSEKAEFVRGIKARYKAALEDLAHATLKIAPYVDTMLYVLQGYNNGFGRFISLLRSNLQRVEEKMLPMEMTKTIEGFVAKLEVSRSARSKSRS